jgi:hypothetical protein
LLDDTAEAKQYQEELAVLLGQQLTDADDLEVRGKGVVETVDPACLSVD